MTEAVDPISEREFNLYALSLLRGPNFYPFEFASAWKAQRGSCVGAVFTFAEDGDYLALGLGRQADHRFVITFEEVGFSSLEDAKTALLDHLQTVALPVPYAPGVKRRPPLLDVKSREVGETFKLLAGRVGHLPALMAVGEAYLAMPRPDDNFVSDFQTENFDSRLWELYLLAVFREQALVVRQDHPSPDFHIESDAGECYVEAVTANASGPRFQGATPPQHAPDDLEERLLGAPAERFAKTLRSKLQRDYDQLPHVKGKPFALAVADFHAPSSMVWSREALPSYLYGVYMHVEERDQRRVAVGTPIERLKGSNQIPAGLFRDPAMANLSAVIFSNAATLSKFNRMGFLAGWRPPGVSMTRTGVLFDRTPGALESIPFKLNVLSDEYASLWPHGEMWCQELEVFHNPAAAYPLPFGLLPGATHWFEEDGELECRTTWANSVLSSTTLVLTAK